MKETPMLFRDELVRKILAGEKTQTRRPVDLSAKAVFPKSWIKKGWTHNPEMARVGDVAKMIGELAGKATDTVSQQISVPIRQHPDDASIPWEACCYERLYCPFGWSGDVLWVREAFYIDDMQLCEGPLPKERPPELIDEQIYYRADGTCCQQIPECACAECGKPRWRPSIHMPKWACRLWLEITEVRVERLMEISEADCYAEGVTRITPGDGSIIEQRCKDPQGRVAIARESFWLTWDTSYGDDAHETNPWVWCISFKRKERDHV